MERHRRALREREPEDGGGPERRIAAVGETERLAHDFNNVLLVVSSGLNLLEESDDPEHREILFARMREAVARGKALTREIGALGYPRGPARR